MARPKSYDAKKLRSLYMEGLSDSEIAKRMDISKTTVFNWRHENKVPPNLPRTLPTPKPAQAPRAQVAEELPPSVATPLPDEPPVKLPPSIETPPLDEPTAEPSPVSDVVEADASAFSAAVADALKAESMQEAEPEPQPADDKQPMTVAQLAEAFTKLANLAPDVPVLLRSGDRETAASAVRITVTYHNAPGEQVAACIS